MGVLLLSRQTNDDLNNDGNWWYWSPTAYAVKWGIVGAIFLFALIYVVGGYLHAQRRMKKGLRPLAYHRFLVSRSQRARFEPMNNYTFTPVNNGYAMNGYPAPPPAYNPAYPPPPNYMPPEGASKAAPAQGEYAPPAGPPPAVNNHSTGPAL
ncbi:MAG: hypothetical protein Q9160_002012 [Pyrenula sp. 1 TL-2023]